MPSRQRRKYPTGEPVRPAEWAMYWIGQHTTAADDMPDVDSPFLVEWFCHEIGPIAVNAAGWLGWRHCWWWVNRGRTERPDGIVIIQWGGRVGG